MRPPSPNNIEAASMTKFCLALSALALGMGAVPAGAASGCNNLSGQHCMVTLTTGVHMSYFDLGSARGETLILLHTDTTSAVEWTWTAAALLSLDPNLHIYALDQRGAGATGLPDTARCWSTPNLCITEADLAGDLLAFMNAKRLRTATLVGHAMGAATARRVALDHPERVVRLILSGTGAPRVMSAAAASRAAASSDVMEPLGWRTMLEAKGVRWPQGALHMRPLDIDPDAVRNIAQHWDISAIAAPQVVDAIAAQTAAETLASWGTLDPTPAPPARSIRLDALRVPTLVLWGSEDAGLTRASEQRLIELLKRASEHHRGMYFYWKQYGVRPPPLSGDKHEADDIGHNLSWEAPRQLAADIDSFVRTGAPTRDLYKTDAPDDIHKILVVPGAAIIVSSKKP
jgi:pimeloyl-ACP methyl ester carboxylesterase